MPPPPPPPSSSLTKPNPSSLSDLIFSAFSLFVFYSSPNFNPNPKRRRFIKFPIMPLTTTSITNNNNINNNNNNNNLTTINRHNFPTPQSLSDWLQPRLPSDSLTSWGTKPGTKNIHNLWLELTDGETSLADSSPPVRTLEVVVVRVRDSINRVLIESHQELSNGDVRKRSRPLSEKMKPGESVEDAVYRAVKEELGSILRVRVGVSVGVRIVPGSYTSKVEERVSVSYPGLPACYVLHTVDAFVDGLPDCEFCTEEEDEYGDLEGTERNELAVSCKKHYWKWIDGNTLPG